MSYEERVVLLGMSHCAWFPIWEDSLVSISGEIRTILLPCPKTIAEEIFLIQVIFLQLGDFARFRFVPFLEVISSLSRCFFNYPTFKCLLFYLTALIAWCWEQ